MKKPLTKFRSHCPITYALDIFGDKWSLLVIRDLMFMKKKYYSEFLEANEKVSTNILADRLSKLEAHNIICKVEDKKKRTRFIYSLTPIGKDLLPMLLEMIEWSAKYDDKTGTPKQLINSIKNSKTILTEEILSKLGK